MSGHPLDLTTQPRTIMNSLLQSNHQSGTPTSTSHLGQLHPSGQQSPHQMPPLMTPAQTPPPQQPQYTSHVMINIPQHRNYPPSVASSTFSSPSGSASSSPYISPSLSSHASSTSLGSQASNLSLASHSLNEGMLLVGSRIQIRGPHDIHPKLASFAYTQAEIVQLPAHPNTWYGVRLRDGRQVKLRKSAFDIVSIYPSSSVNSSPNLQPSQYSPTYNQQSQLSYSPYELQQQHYQVQQSYNPYANYQTQPKIVYQSPEPSPSPLPPNPTTSMTMPALGSLTVSTPQMTPQQQPTSTQQVKSEPLASEEVYEELDLNASATKQEDQVMQPSPESHYPSDQEHQHHHHHSHNVNDHSVTSATLVLNSKRKPVPRALSPEADTDEDDEDGEHHQDDDGDEDDMDMDEDDDGTDESYAKKKKQHKSSTPSNKTASASGGSGGKSARQRRGRGRALLGLNVVITNGRYKGETGLVVRGANGYYSVKFHRPISELRSHENTAMKRSSELAPITPNGKRLQLPIPPAQRKLMKQQAMGGVSSTSSSNPPSVTSSPRIRAQAEKRKASVSFTGSDRSERRRAQRRKDAQGGYNSSSSTEGDQSGDENDSRRSRSPSPDGGDHMYSSGGEYEDAPHLTHSRSHSSSSSRSSSPSMSGGSEGSQSPTQTELLSPHSYPVSPAQHHYTLTPLTSGSSIPVSPATSHQYSSTHLPNMVLPPSIGSHSNVGSKTANMRSQSPGIKQAASILLELSHENEIPESFPPTTYALTHIKQEVRPEQWMSGGHVPANRWTTAH